MMLTSYFVLLFELSKVLAVLFSERDEFRNLRIEENLIKYVQSSNSVDCCRQCRNTDVCKSFAYNSQTTMCNLISDIKTSVSGTIEQGWKYFAKECAMNEGYLFFSMLCIKYHGTMVTHDEAVTVCKSEGSSLIKIDSFEKQNKVPSKLSEIYNIKGFVHIQGQRIGNSTSWIFDDGTPISYMPWNLGQPENYNGQNYLVVNTNSQWQWHDSHKTYKFSFLCEHII